MVELGFFVFFVYPGPFLKNFGKKNININSSGVSSPTKLTMRNPNVAFLRLIFGIYDCLWHFWHDNLKF